jgi:hypothetical protein
MLTNTGWFAVAMSVVVGSNAAAATGDRAGLESARTVLEVRANQFTDNAQERAAIAIDPQSGRLLAAWASRRQEQGGSGVFGRLFDASGEPIGGEIHFNQYLVNNQQEPAVAFDAGGRAWVAWTSFTQDGHMGAVVLRRFGMRDGLFAAMGDEMIVNTSVAGDQFAPAVAAGAHGAMVVWRSRDVEGHAAVARVFDADGRPVGDEIRIAPLGAEIAHATVAAQPDGSFVVVTADRSVAGVPQGLSGRRFSAAGELLGDSFAVTADNERHHVEPAIGVDRLGGFVVAWMARGERAGWDVAARRFSADGAPIGDVIEVERAAGDGWLSGVDVSVAPDGRFAVICNVEAMGAATSPLRAPKTPSVVMARWFDADGSPLGEPCRVASAEPEARRAASIASPAKRAAWNEQAGALAIAWDGATEGDSSGVGLSMIRVDPPAVTAARLAMAAPVIDRAILAASTLADAGWIPRFPPDYDPFFVPEPPDQNILNPGTDFGFQGFQNTGWNPPDPDLAVGPDHVVVAVNGGIRFFTKGGTMTFEDDISGAGGFWGEVGATSFVFDPVCVFDVQSGRYIVVTTEHADNGDDCINLAVSDDSDPNGTWHKYRFIFSSVGDFIDFPNLGVGPDAVYVCCDYFSGNTGNRIHIFNKQDVINGQPTTPRVVTTSGGFRSLGAVNHLTTDAPAQYFATSFDGSNSQIGLDAIRDPNGTPVRNSILLNVPAFSQPPGAEQLGSTNRVATVDMRIKNGVYRDGILYLAHTIGQNNTARVRWYRVAMNGWPTSGQNPQLLESGTQNLGAGVHNWFPDISVDDQERIGIGFNQSSPSEYVSVRRTFRLPSDPVGTLREPRLMQESNSPENGSRWGDYGGVESDPVEPGVFWNHHEYRTTSWRTWIGRFDINDDILPLAFDYPGGRPQTIDSDGGTAFLVEVRDQGGVAQPDTGVLHVDRGAGFEAFAMNHLGNNIYEAVFPASDCGTPVSYYVSAETTEGDVVTDPADAPAGSFSAESWSDFAVVLADDFEADLGWTVVNENLTDGAWNRGLPLGDGSRGDPTADFDGSGQCFLTDNAAGNSDVDGGPTRLLSPVFDLAAADNASISYARWFYNDDGDIDRLTVEISNNGGTTWTLVESVADSNTGGWVERTIDPASFVTLTNQMRMRFSATDNPNDSVTEAGIDAFRVVRRSCSGGTTLDSFEVVTGSVINGTIESLRESDDARLRTRSGFGRSFLDLHLLDLVVHATTAASNPATIDLTIESRINQPSGTARVRLRNWNTNQFEQVSQYAIGNTEATQVISGINASNYVAGDGSIDVSIRHVVFVPIFAFQFDSFFDQVKIEVE